MSGAARTAMRTAMPMVMVDMSPSDRRIGAMVQTIDARMGALIAVRIARCISIMLV